MVIKMFQIITFKQLGIVAFILCFLMLLGATLNVLTPYVSIVSQNKVTLPIIMYHQISENKNILGDYVITPSLLEEDFIFLKKNGYTPISFRQLKNYVYQKIKLPEKPIIITFDDGERTFLTKVVPLLEKYDFCANVNIIGTLVKQYSESGETDDRYAYLNEDDVAELSRNQRVELGCHTYNLHSFNDRHGMGRILYETDIMYKKVLQDDIDLFKDYFNKLTNYQTDIFAYPYGIKNPIVEEVVESNGYNITLSCREAINQIYPDCSLYNLGRFNRPYSETSADFFNRIFKN